MPNSTLADMDPALDERWEPAPLSAEQELDLLRSENALLRQERNQLRAQNKELSRLLNEATDSNRILRTREVKRGK